MRKIIKSTDLIPSIFNIDKYVDMDKITAFNWFYLLETRCLIHQRMLDDGLSFWVGDAELNEIEEQEAIQLIMNIFFNNPLDVNLSVNFKKHNGQMILIEISDTSHYSFMRDNLPVSHLYEDEVHLWQTFLGIYSEKLRERGGENENYRSIAEIIKSHIGDNFMFINYPIIINPYYPDSVIIENLKKILAEIRSEKGFEVKSKALSKKDLINWASYKLLPYFDLKILEVYGGVKFTNSVVCSVLYPKGEYGEDNLRKSVEPLRQKFLNQVGYEEKEISLFDSLCYLAYGEISENGKI